LEKRDQLSQVFPLLVFVILPQHEFAPGLSKDIAGVRRVKQVGKSIPALCTVAHSQACAVGVRKHIHHVISRDDRSRHRVGVQNGSGAALVAKAHDHNECRTDLLQEFGEWEAPYRCPGRRKGKPSREV
jgi:hypothetical protein